MNYLTRIYFGAGKASIVPPLLRELGCERPLLVTDAGLMAVGLHAALELDHATIYDGVETNPTEESVLEALVIYREAACDGIVALGGGSSLDLAKLVGLLATHAGPLSAYAAQGGDRVVRHPLPPLVLVPTTAGSGSEVGRAALATVEGRKLGFISPLLLPAAAVCDPQLTRSLPSHLTAACGMDAISHGVEAACSPRWNPVADALALDGLERALSYIRIAFADGNDLEARSQMLLASLEVGLAFQKGLGAVHALSHPLGGWTQRQLHHGVLNGIFLPHVLRYNLDHCRGPLSQIARRSGLRGPDAAPNFFSELIESLNLPCNLRSLGIERDEAVALAPLATADHCCATNPRPLGEADCAALYAAAW